MQVVQAVQAAEAAHGAVDVLICCAGAAELGELLVQGQNSVSHPPAMVTDTLL